MLTRDEKKKLKEQAIERKNPPRILQDSDGRDVAKMINQGFDFPWCYGQLEPLEHFHEYKPIFDEVRHIKSLEEQASKDGNEAEEDRLSDEVSELLDKISEMGFRIYSTRSDDFANYNTLNIVGLGYEYK